MVDPKEILSALVNYELIKGFADHKEALSAFAAILNEKKFMPQTKIIVEMDKNLDLEMYFLFSGRLTVSKISKQGEVVRIGRMVAEDFPFFGEAAVLGVNWRSATVEADTLCRCYVLSKASMDQFSNQHPSASLLFYKALCESLFKRIEKTNRDVLYLCTENKAA